MSTTSTESPRAQIGVTGLADALLMCGARYGSSDAVALSEGWMKAIQRAAYLASVELAAERGAFPLYDKDKYLAGETVAFALIVASVAWVSRPA